MTYAREDLASDVQVVYNGFVFPTNLEITGFRSVPVLDRAQRTFTGLRHSVTVQFHVNTFENGQTADADVAAIRTQLMQMGGCLQLGNTAFGNYVINPQGGVVVAGAKGMWELAWGPKPTSFEQKPYYKYGSTLTWTCEFLVNACAGGEQVNAILEWNYGLSFAIDRSGYTTRTLKGSVSIPLTRQSQSNRTLSASVDALREKITPSLAIGFRRESQNFELSEDKRTLSFTFVDQQMPPNVPPDNCVVAEASHSVDVDCKNPNRVVQTIRASYELPSARARGEALSHFIALVQSRVTTAQQKKLMLMPLHFHASEPEIYGRRSADFSFSYYISYTKLPAGGQPARLFPPATFLQDSGLWQPVPTSKWTSWSKSMIANGVSTPRGTAGLVFNAKEDAIVDLCSEAVPVQVELTARLPRQPSILIALFGTQKPTPIGSWLHYVLRMEVKPIDQTRVLTTCPTSPIKYAAADTDFNDVQGYEIPYANLPANIVQIAGAPRVVVTLSGAATRVGYNITPPQLVNVSDQIPLPYNDESCGFRTWVVGSGGFPIVQAQWRFRYILTASPEGDFGTPNNPVLGGVGSGDGLRELKGTNYS